MSIQVRSYTTKELLLMYGTPGRPLSRKTWASWLRPIREQLGPILGKEYTPKQVEMIFNHLGAPSKEIDA